MASSSSGCGGSPKLRRKSACKSKEDIGVGGTCKGGGGGPWNTLPATGGMPMRSGGGGGGGVRTDGIFQMLAPAETDDGKRSHVRRQRKRERRTLRSAPRLALLVAMNSSSYDTIFARAGHGQPGFLEGPMNSSSTLILAEGQPGAIATRKLGACSGVVVLGRTAAIVAHISPGDPNARQGQFTAEQHFRNLFAQVEQQYIIHRTHFPTEATAWGIYIADFDEITNDLRAYAAQRFAALGLPNGHTYYTQHRGPNRRDEVRVCVQLSGSGITSFYLEQQLIQSIQFPRPLPGRHAPYSAVPAAQRNYLAYYEANQAWVHFFAGRSLVPETARLSGVYDILFVDRSERNRWLKYDFTSRGWVAS
ncbi:hypothetical protein LTR74_016460 [Friedmanniomyces endolithicus]|nr:hypothetical protein LTR74_016460 [Friedmanniomyces endolithicus]